MKGYIYTMYAGADPGNGHVMTDPIFKPVPTLGACVPNVRRAVRLGDYVFAISGRVRGLKQYVVGGFRVAEKIDALAAHGRFPENRVHRAPGGLVLGNVIVDEEGKHHPLDAHGNFLGRLQNYLVGEGAVVVESPGAVAAAREATMPVLNEIFGTSGSRPFDAIARGRSMDEDQVERMLKWLGPLASSK